MFFWKFGCRLILSRQFGFAQGDLCLREGKCPRLHSQAFAWQPRLSAERRESGSQCPCHGEGAPQPECSSVCVQKPPYRLGFPGAQLQSRVVCMWFGAFPCAFGLPSTVPVQGNQPLSPPPPAHQGAEPGPGSRDAWSIPSVSLLRYCSSGEAPQSPQGRCLWPAPRYAALQKTAGPALPASLLNSGLWPGPSSPSNPYLKLGSF